MKKVTEKTQSGGRLEIFEDFNKNLFLARPHGIINPSLLEEDLERARRFSNQVNGAWTYVTNTEDVWLVNPFNLLYLKEVKKIKNLRQIVVFAPNPINRFLLKMSWILVKHDRVITKKKEFLTFIDKLQ